MSKVNATMFIAMPKITARPRVVKHCGMRYRVENGQIEVSAHDGPWTSSAYNGMSTAALLDAPQGIRDLIATPTETVTAPAAEPTITITMPKHYAVTLQTVLNNVGGHPRAYRGEMADLTRALYNAGIMSNDGIVDEEVRATNAIYLKSDYLPEAK